MAASLGVEPATRGGRDGRNGRARRRPPRAILGACRTTHADLVLTGGRIFTADAARSWAQALAVPGGRIVAVGGDRDVRAARRARDARHRRCAGGPSRRVSATPRPPDRTAGSTRLQCDLTDAPRHGRVPRARSPRTPPPTPTLRVDPRRRLVARATSRAASPRREDLDRVVPDRPVFLPNRDGHDAWVNSRGARARRHHGRHPDPHDGRIARNPDGSPLGTLHEGAQDLVERHIPPTSDAELDRALLESQRLPPRRSASPTGRTRSSTPTATPRTCAVAGRGELTARVVGALWWEHDAGLEQVEAFVARRAEGPVGRYAATQRQADGRRDHREPDGGDGRALLRGRSRDRQPRHDLHRSETRCARPSSPARRPRLPAPLPRARRPGGAPRARRGRGCPRRQRLVRHPAPPRPPPGHPPRRPARGSGSSARSPTRRPCGRSTRTRWTCSRCRSWTPRPRAASTRCARCAATARRS